MAATTVYSPNITNIIANPPVKNSPCVDGGIVRCNSGTMAIATTSIDDVGDIIRLERLPSNAVLLSFLFSTTDMDTGTAALAFNVGCYYADGVNAGTVVDADNISAAVLASGVTATTVSLNSIELLLFGKTLNATTSVGHGVPLWQLMGLSSDPGGNFDVGLTISTVAATAAAGVIAWRILWTKGN